MVQAKKREEQYGLRVLAKLVAAKTENPPGNEWRTARIVGQEFGRMKIPFKKFEKTRGRTNLLAYVGKGSPNFFWAHTWTRFPLEKAGKPLLLG
jgi:hypothetical protein